MENEFLQKVNLELLKKDMRMTQQQIAELVDLSEKGLYKWTYDKSNGGTRPTYDVVKILLEHGASLKALFGIDAPFVPVSESAEEFDAKVKESMLRILSK